METRITKSIITPQNSQSFVQQIPGLSSSDKQALMMFLDENKSCAISVCDDSYEFCERMASRQNNELGKVVFGRVQFAKSLMRKGYVGILEGPKVPAVVAIYRGDQCAVYIYIPK